MTLRSNDPGRAAYEARFAHARPRDVEPWDSLPPEVKAIWARVEAACIARVATALDDACRMDSIRLKVGELTPQEQQLASIVAGLVRGAVAEASGAAISNSEVAR